jgi:hypothetical protein
MGDGKDRVAQPQLVPIEAWFCGPIETGTADASDGCFCRDNTGWIIKKSKPDNLYSPHNEWICANLAAKAGVPIAPFNIVKHTEKQEWFGSQFQIGEVKDWWLQVLDGSISIDELRDDLSRIYAFDLFVANTDRHTNNFMIVQNGGSHQALAIDHGRSWFFNGFPPIALPLPWCNTMKAFFWMKQNFAGFPVKPPMLEILSAIAKIKYTDVVDILSRQPTIWLDDQKKNDIVDWWKSGKAIDRTTLIIQGVNDGSLL